MRIPSQLPAAGLLLSLLAAAPPAGADLEDLSAIEFKCRDQLATIYGKLAKAETTCAVQCRKKGLLTPFTDCGGDPPPGSETALCREEARTAALAKAAKFCQSDGTDADSCPEGYEFLSGDCATFVNENANFLALLISTASSLLSCDDGPLAGDETKCQLKAMGAYAKWGDGRGKCFRKCRVAEAKGKTDGDCDPSAIGDTKTLECLGKNDAKLDAKLASACADEPECVDPDLLRDATIRPVIDAVAVGVSNPPLPACCDLYYVGPYGSGPICFWIDPTTCLNSGGTPGAPGTACDSATGTCDSTTTPGLACCNLSGDFGCAGGSYAVGGFGLTCTSDFGGTIETSVTCNHDGTCS